MKVQRVFFKLGLIATVFYAQTALSGDDRYNASCQTFGNKIVLNYDDEKFKGQVVLPLREIVRRTCRSIRLPRHIRLQNITLLARSKKSYGVARLEVGGRLGQIRHLNGSYRPVVLTPQRGRRTRQGSWNLHLVGKIKVAKVIISLRYPFPHRPSSSREEIFNSF